MKDLDDLFSEELVSRLESPRLKKIIQSPAVKIRGGNPVCGDQVEYDIEIKDGIIRDVSLRCKGCFMSSAGADIAAEYVIGKSIEEALRLDRKVVLEELKEVVGIRERCALVGFDTIRHALETLKLSKSSEDHSTPIKLEFRV